MNLLKFFRSTVYLAITLIPSVFIIGILEYRFISDLAWINALYMTVITVSPVGFSEVDLQLQPKSKVTVLGRPGQLRKLHEMFYID